MNFFYYFKQTFIDLSHQKLRTFLTTMGITWGTVSIILLLSLGESVHKNMMSKFSAIGENVVAVWRGRTTKAYKGYGVKREIRFTDDDIPLILSKVPQIRYVDMVFQRNAIFKNGDKSFSQQVSGVSPEYHLIRNINSQSESRFINQQDVLLGRRVIFLGDALAKDLFGTTKVIGKTVSINSAIFTIIGVMEKKSSDSDFGGGRDTNTGFIPRTTFKSMFSMKYPRNMVYQLKDAKDSQLAHDNLLLALSKKYGFDPTDQEALPKWDSTEMIHFFDLFLLGFRAFLGILGICTLVVSGIGVANIMHVIVEERTREIGVKMALGAKPKVILYQFLYETLLIVFVGGVLGYLVSFGILSLVALFHVEEAIGVPEISFFVASIAFVSLGVLAFFSGIFPARRAAKLPPVEALKSM